MTLEQLHDLAKRLDGDMDALVQAAGTEACSSVNQPVSHVFRHLNTARDYVQMLINEAEALQPADCVFDLYGKVAA